MFSRKMSPVEMCGIPYAFAASLAKVPFPAPGGPKKIKFILNLLLNPIKSAFADGLSYHRNGHKLNRCIPVKKRVVCGTQKQVFDFEQIVISNLNCKGASVR